MTKKILILGALALVLGVLPSCKKSMENSPPAADMGKVLYHCAMHPQIVSEKPGECPICHMQLTRMNMAPQDGAMVPGQATVRMTPGMEQRIGVQTAEALVRDLVMPVRAAARVAYDPQLYSAALEHREARSFLSKTRQTQDAQAIEQAQSTVEASALRLHQMGLSDEQIEDISKPDYDPSSLLVGSRSGRLWIYADVFDNQINLIHIGQMVELTTPAMPGALLHGEVRGIDPVVNAETRTVRVRISAQNPQGQLKPDMYVSAVIEASLGKTLTVPESAVMDTGTRQLVYRQTQPGTYEPCPVRTGRQAEGYVEILEGLHAGDKVASAANFLIDSESRIDAAAQGMGKP